MIVETPGSAHVGTIAHGLLLLAEEKVDLCSFLWKAFLCWQKINAVAIYLIVTIDIDGGSEAFVDKGFGRQSDREGLGLVRNCDVRLNNAVAILCCVLLERDSGIGPLDLTHEIPQFRHAGSFVSSRGGN